MQHDLDAAKAQDCLQARFERAARRYLSCPDGFIISPELAQYIRFASARMFLLIYRTVDETTWSSAIARINFGPYLEAWLLANQYTDKQPFVPKEPEWAASSPKHEQGWRPEWMKKKWV